MKNATLLKAMMFLMLIAATHGTFAQTVIISPTGDGGFETGNTFALNNWTLVNGSQTNQWALGTAASGYTGNRAAYISNNGGVSNVITNATSVVHFYRDVVFPAGQTQITLSFSFKQATLDQTFDYMKVYLVSTSTTPVSGTELSSGQIGNSEYPGASALSSFTIFTITIPAANAGTTKRLVFSWHNDAANPKGAGAIDNISLTTCAPITVTASSNTPVCAGNNLNLTSTSTAASFSWSGPNGFSSSSQNPTIAGATTAATGTYTVVASNGICSNSTTTSVTVNAATSITTQPSNATACETASTSLVVAATGGSLTYQWQDNSSGSFANIGGATSATLSLSGVTLAMNGRQYRCNINGTCGSITSNTVTLTINPKPVGVASVASQSICTGNAITAITLSTSNGVPGTTYNWTRSNTGTVTGIASPGSANPISGTLNNLTVGPLTTTFTITPTAAGCAGSAFTSDVTVNPNTTISVQPAAQTKCAGSNANYSVTAGGASLTYQWQDNSTGSFVDISGATNASLTVSGVTVGMNGWQYRCAVSGVCGMLTSNSALLTVNAVPVVSASSNPVNGVICGSGSVTLTATGAASYGWAPGGATSASISVSPLTTTTYTVTGTTSGCSATASSNVTVYPAVSALASASLSAVCQNGNSVLTAAGGNSTNYAISSIPYSAPLGSGSSAVSGDDNVSGSIALPFTFSYYGVNYNNLFAYTNGFVQLGTSSGSTTVYGQSLPSATAPNNIIAGVLSDLNAVAGSITTFTTGSTPNRVFTIYYNNVAFYCSSGGGCSGNKQGNINFQIRLYEKSNIVEIHMNNLSNNSTSGGALKTMGIENAAGTLAKVPVGRNGSDGNWTVSTPEAWRFTPNGGTLTYSWSPSTYLTNASAINPTAQNMQLNQNYTVTVTDQNGCSDAASSAITVNPLPTITVTPASATAFCAGGNVTLNATAGLSSYSWNTSPVQTTQSITVNTAANYTVTGTNSNNCSNVASQLVTVYDTLPANITVIGSANLCTGQTTTDLQATQTNAVSYVWNTTEPTSLITVATAGNYSVTATDNFGCLHHQSQVITASAPPAAPIVVPASSTVLCSDGITTTSVVLNVSNYTSDLLWSTSETTTGITVDYADIFNVTYTDANGCFSSSNSVATQVKIYSTDPTAALTNAVSNSICPGSGTTLSVQGGSLGDDAVWTWYEGSCSGAALGTGSSLPVNPASTTTYFVRAEGPCNITNCASVTVIIKTTSADPSTASNSAPILCGSGNSNLSVSGGSLGTGANWVWYEGGCGNGASIGSGATLNVTPSVTTVYYVRAEGDCNISNCAQATVTVKSPSVDPSSASPSAPILCGSGNSNLSVSGGSLGTGANWVWYEGGCGNGASIGTGSSLSVSPSVTTVYYVRAEGDCNISNCAQATVTVKSLSVDPSSASPSAPILCGSGNSNLSVSGGSLGTGANWVWYEGGCGNGASIGSGVTLNVTPSVTTIYYVRAEGDCNISNCAQATVTVKSLSVDPSTASPSAPILCGSGNSNLSVSGGSLGTGANWVWYEGGCGNGASIGSGATLNVTPSVTTVYYVRAEGDCNISNCAQATVTVKSLSVDPSTASPSAPILCGSGNSNLSVSGGSLGTGANWVWYAGGCGTGASIGTGSSLSVSPSATTVYYVRAEGDCNISNCAQATVTVKSLSVDPTLATNNAAYSEICNGNPVQLNVSGGSLGSDADWVWYEGGCGNGASVATGSSPSATPSGGGVHTFYVRAEGYCNITTCVTVNVTVKTSGPGSTVNAITAPVSACTGNAGSLLVNSVPNATYYSWSGPAGVLFNGNAGPYQTTSPNAAATFGSLPGGSSGYSICVFAGNACGQSNTICKWVRGKVSAPGAIAGSSTGCPNVSSVYSVAPVAGADTYTWTVVGNDATLNGTSLISITTAVPNVTVDFAAPFVGATLQVYASLSCGYNSAARSLAISRYPSAPGTMSGNSYVCPNASATYSVSPVSGAATYNWTCTVPGAVISPAGNTASIFFPSSIPAGSTVCVTALSGCGYASITRCKGIATGLPNVPSNISGPASGQCGATGVSYSIPPVNSATSYLWTVSNGSASISGPNNLSSLTVDFTGNLNSVQLSVSAGNSCGNSAVRTVTVLGKPGLPAAIAGNNSVCNGSVESYTTAGSTGATLMTWTVPANATIIGGQGSSNLLVLWGSTGGLLKVNAANDCGTSGFTTLPINITCRQSQLQNTLESYVKVYPNPAHDKMKVEINALTSDRTNIELINSLGEIVYRSEMNIQEGTNLLELNLENMAKGFYNLSIQGTSVNSQQRVVIE